MGSVRAGHGPAPTENNPIPSLLERFTTELEALGGKVTECLESELAGLILGLLMGKGIRAVMAWDGAQLPRGLLEVLQGGGIDVSLNPDPSIRAGITGAVAGVAETGTLVIPSGAGRPLTASLLPEVHIAVLRMANIYPSLSQVLNLPEVREASAVALVSGPSRTADIEMALTIGVHGPGEVYVFLVG
jgi:L-lactate dehydrogenase complex protein LldG